MNLPVLYSGLIFLSKLNFIKFIGFVIEMRVICEVVFIARFKIIVGGKVIEKTVIVRALPIFETLEVNLTRLNFFSVVDFFAGLRNICAALDLIHDVELQSPNDIGRIFNAAGFFKTLERNGLIIVGAIERADDNEGGIGVALKFFEFADGIVYSEFDIIFMMRNDLKIIEADNRSFAFAVAERTKKVKQVVNRFVLKFNDLEVSRRFSHFVNYVGI